VYSAVPKLSARDFRRQAYLSVFRYLAEHRKITLWYAKVLGRAASKLGGFALSEDTWQPFELSLRNTIMQQLSYEDLRALKMPTDVIYGRYDVLVLRKNLQHFFHPSKNLHFYEINELHRISARAGQLISQLIMGQNELDFKHARRVELKHMQEHAHHSSPVESRRLLFVSGGAAVVVFLLAAAAAWHGNLPGWELQLFKYINNVPTETVVNWIARVASDSVWAIVFITALLLLVKRYRKAAWRVAAPAGSAYVAEDILGHIIKRGRPEALLQPHDLILRASQDGYGFPSGHVATLTAVVLVLWPYLNWQLKVAGVLLMVLVGWSRIYLGVHFPLDVVGGFALGVTVVCCIKVLPNWLRKRFYLI